MSLDFSDKDKDILVQNVIDYIQENVDFDIDFSDGEPLKTIIEAVMQEMDLQYWQLQQAYEGSFIDTSFGDDLSELVKILGIERDTPKFAIGTVNFFRDTPAEYDYFIPTGTLIETLPNNEGVSYRYETTQDATLETGETEIVVNIRAVEGGRESNVIANKIIVINDPPLGIESVNNPQPIIGGEDEETDEDLKERAKTVLDSVGLGTVDALKNNITNIDGIKEVSVLDMERGIGTVDVLVLGDIIPLSDTIKDKINVEINKTKAGGIDVELQEPVLNLVDIDATLTIQHGFTIDSVRADVIKSIENYVNFLAIGQPLIKNQLERFILNTSDLIIDVIVSSPEDNIAIGSKDILRINTITLQ